MIGSLPQQRNLSTVKKLELLDGLKALLPTLPQGSWYPQSGPQSLAYISEADELFFGGSAGGGKALDVCTPIPTPQGFVPIGEIKRGDRVLDSSGKPCTVTTAFAPFIGDTYRITFDDGEQIDACTDHKWLTFNAKELNQLTRHTPEWRAARRKRRPSRKTENSQRSTLLIAANKMRRIPVNDPPQGSVRTTLEISRSLTTSSGRANHAIPVCKAIDGVETLLPIDPYLFGVWLGDGSTYKAEITTADPFIIQEWELAGYRTQARGSRYAYGVYGLLSTLKSMGVIGGKYVPPEYLWAGFTQRLDLLKGLMDTDGCVRKHGSVEFTSTNFNIAEAVRHLVTSLGWKATIREGRATLYGKDCGPKYRIVFTPDQAVFRLPRKRDNQRLGTRRTSKFRYIKSCVRIESKAMRCIAVDSPDHLFLAGKAFIPTHNSDLILGLALTAHVNSLIVRLQSTQLTGFKNRMQEVQVPGDRWQGIGPHGGILRTHDGRQVEFSGCETFSDAVKKFRGRAHDLKAWDELPTIPENVFTFVNGWNRTTVPGQRCRVVGAGNPPSRPEEEWVLDYWKPWLREVTAEPGEIRWFIRVENKWVEVEDNKPVQVGRETIQPRSRTFIPARLEDNPILEKSGYRHTLINLPEPYKSQLLYGDMKIGLSDDARQLLPTEWVVAAMKRWTEKPPKGSRLKAISCDPARGGSNRSVLARRYDNWVAPLISIPGKETPDGPTLANKAIMWIDSIYAPFIIDITGTAGGGLHDAMRLLHPTIPSYAFVAAGASKYLDRSGRIKMRNKRTEAYWRLRDALDPIHGIDLMLPPSDDLKVELCAGRWYMFSSGAGLEEKEEITKRLGGDKSPDLADAVAMLFMDVDATGGWVTEAPPRTMPFMGSDLRQPEEKMDKYEIADAKRAGQSYRDPWS